MKTRSTNPAGASPLLTIGVPAYNVGPYLTQCLKSLTLNEHLAEKLEIIVIDDGSTDDTPSVGRQLTSSMPNAHIITKENGGHGSAINAALRTATAKYFKLLDGDDWLDSVALESLIEHLETTESDIVLTNYVEYYSNTRAKKPIYNYTGLEVGRTYDIESESIFDVKGPLLATTTFKTALYKDSPFFIDEHCYYVDVEYNFFIYQRAKTLEFLALDLYVYRLEREGQSMQVESIKRNHLDHGRVTLRVARELDTAADITLSKRAYLLDYIVAPVIRSHYQILIEFLKSRKLFMSFDTDLKHYPEVYRNPLICGKIISVHRVFGGYTVGLDRLLRKVGRFTNDSKR